MENIKYSYLTLLLLIAGLFSCEDLLDSPPPAEFAPENILTSQEGIQAVLFSAYQYQNPHGASKDWVNIFEGVSDVSLVTEGGEAGNVAPFSNWTWDPSHRWLNNSIWLTRYRSIRDANLVIANIDNFEGEATVKQRLLSEAIYIRASNYAFLYNLFGPVVLRESPGEPKDKARASDDEMLGFIESQLELAAAGLPDPGNLPSDYGYGRATKGSALGFLTKHYLNTKQWQKAAETAQRVVDLNYYTLFPDFHTMFMVKNEGNREMIVAFPNTNLPGGYHINLPNGNMSQDFKKAPNIPEFERIPGQIEPWPTNFKIRDWIVDSFDPADARATLIITEYESTTGEVENYRDQREDNARSLKFFDQGAVGARHGNDFPWIRYADILLSRAEALNELNGPTQEVLDLINMVRNRANLDDLTMTDAPDKASLRDRILMERVWEFINEGKRREDLLRHDMLVSNAQSRGISTAQAHRNLFPIPVDEASNNDLIVQNPGY